MLGPGDQFGACELIDGRAHEWTYSAATRATVAVTFGATFRAVAGPIRGIADAARTDADRRRRLAAGPLASAAR